MKFPLVSRKRLDSANARVHILESANAKAGDDIERLKESLIAANAETERLTAAFEKLTADYNKLGTQIPAFRPKRVKWNGPGGARELMERAAFDESSAGKAQRAAQSVL